MRKQDKQTIEKARTLYWSWVENNGEEHPNCKALGDVLKIVDSQVSEIAVLAKLAKLRSTDFTKVLDSTDKLIRELKKTNERSKRNPRLTKDKP